MEHLNHRLAEAAGARAQWEKLKRQAARLESEQRQAAARAQQLQAELAKEERDVQKLEGTPLSSLLSSLIGNREEKLYQERQEAAEALVRYEEARHHADQLAAELATLQAEIARLSGVESTYQALLAEKERLLRAERGAAADELLWFDREEERLQAQIREVEEAHQAGLTAQAGLERARDALNSAEGWGTWDMLGGGLISTMVKHSRIDEAQWELHAIQDALARFRRELADVAGSLEVPSIQIDGFGRFADYFFDNFLVDWMVQSRINEAQASVAAAHSQVTSLNHWLAEQAGSLRHELEQVRVRRQAYVADHR